MKGKHLLQGARKKGQEIYLPGRTCSRSCEDWNKHNLFDGLRINHFFICVKFLNTRTNYVWFILTFDNLWITWWIIWLFLHGCTLISSRELIGKFFSPLSQFFGYFSSFLGLFLALVHTLFGIVSFPSGLARLHGIIQYHFLLLSLSRSSWLLLSLLILALDSSLSSLFFEKFHPLRYESAMDGAEPQKNRLWPPCCATPSSSSSSSSSSSCLRARDIYR